MIMEAGRGITGQRVRAPRGLPGLQLGQRRVMQYAFT